mmetsp:Transcript_23958/g.51786  ORF Transcript_23958/g.51786 Transcript_23958/m.51786 type:complete len:313 (+) Transcript_23958:296-1234(+)
MSSWLRLTCTFRRFLPSYRDRGSRGGRGRGGGRDTGRDQESKETEEEVRVLDASGVREDRPYPESIHGAYSSEGLVSGRVAHETVALAQTCGLVDHRVHAQYRPVFAEEEVQVPGENGREWERMGGNGGQTLFMQVGVQEKGSPVGNLIRQVEDEQVAAFGPLDAIAGDDGRPWPVSRRGGQRALRGVDEVCVEALLGLGSGDVQLYGVGVFLVGVVLVVLVRVRFIVCCAVLLPVEVFGQPAVVINLRAGGHGHNWHHARNHARHLHLVGIHGGKDRSSVSQPSSASTSSLSLLRERSVVLHCWGGAAKKQ